jgi:hypothetical protein
MHPMTANTKMAVSAPEKIQNISLANSFVSFMTKKMMRTMMPPTKQSKPKKRPLLAL